MQHDMRAPAAIAAWSVVLCGTLAAAVIDARKRKIPNILTFPMLLAGLIYAAAMGGNGAIQSSIMGCLALGVPYVLLFIFAGGGAGDAKLMGAIGAWLGLSASVPVLVFVAIMGGVLGIAYALIRGRMGAVGGNLRTMAFGVGLVTLQRAHLSDAQAILPDKNRMTTMPYGVSIFVGTLMAAGWVMLWH